MYEATALETADMNGDTRTDVIVDSVGALDVLLQTRGGTLQARCPFPSLAPEVGVSASIESSLAIGDLNDDGRPDAAGAQDTQWVRLAEQIAPGSHLATSLAIDPLGIGPDRR